MTECVIIYRNPGNGEVGYFGESLERNGIKVWATRDEAIDFVMSDHPLVKAEWPMQIVELDEL